MPIMPGGAHPYDPDVRFTVNTERHGRPVHVNNVRPEEAWKQAVASNLTTLIRVIYYEECSIVPEVAYAKTKAEKIDLLLNAKDDCLLLFAWPGRHAQDIFYITDVADALQALGLRPAKIDPIVDAEGREWLRDDAPLSPRQRAISARSRPIFLDDSDPDDFDT